MITKIHLENFKGIKERQTIELKPITLLFGANSAGKSTVIQALHYFREILSRKNFDPDTTLYGGNAIDFGGFKTFVYNHDLNLPITLKVEMDIGNLSFPEYSSELEKDFNYQEDRSLLDNLDLEAKSIAVQIKVIWHKILDKAIVTEYVSEINEKIFSLISLDNYTEDGKSYYKISLINYSHPYFKKEKIDIEDKVVKVSEFLILNSNLAKDFIPELLQHNADPLIKLESQDSAIPNWGEFLKIDSNYFDSESETYSYELESLFVEFLTKATTGPGELILDELSKFRYIGPMRKIPPRNYAVPKFRNESRWADGLAAWDILNESDDSFVKRVSRWLSNDDLLNTGYSVEIKEFKEMVIDDPLMISLVNETVLDDIDNLKAELNKIPLKKHLILIDSTSRVELLPYDVGVGISQILPVVVGALFQRDSILAIEQPELHVHPAIQVNLGDLFISQIQDKACVFLIETHSEHLMLRLLRRIEETTEDQLPPGKDPLKAEQVSVNYFEQSVDGIQIMQIPIDKTGEFTKPWPKGFFEERAEELFG